MLERVENIISSNGLDYKIIGDVIEVKFGRVGGKVRIKYDYATEAYLYNCSEYALCFSSFILFSLVFNMMFQPEKPVWYGYITGLMFAGAVWLLFQVALAHIQMLDLKSQLRGIGVHLKSGS